MCRFLHLCVQLGSLVIPGFTLIVMWISFPPPSRCHDCPHLCLVHSAVSVSPMCINSPVLFFKPWYLWIFPSFSLPPCLNLDSLLFFAFLGIFVFSFTVYLTYILPVSCVAESLCHYHILMYFDITFFVIWILKYPNQKYSLCTLVHFKIMCIISLDYNCRHISLQVMQVAACMWGYVVLFILFGRSVL